jgi:hypothetical protein
METTVNQTVRQATTDNMTRELNVRARNEAQKPVKPAKNINTGEAISTTPTPAVKEHVTTFADEMDTIIGKGGKWADMIAKATTAGIEHKCSTKVSIGQFKAHINYRIKHNPAYLGGLVLTDEGIGKPTNKKK